MLSGSLSHNLVSAAEFIVLNDFVLSDGSVGSVELLGLNFTVDAEVTAVFYIVNQRDEAVYPNGVSETDSIVLGNIEASG